MLKTKPLPHVSRSVLLRVTTLIIAVFAAASFGTDSKSRTNRFEEEILAFEAADQKNPVPKGAILFVGDSLFTLWKSIQTDLPEYTVINRGFGGSQMSDLLYYTDRIVIPYKPRLIIVNEGGNDIHRGRMPEQVLADVRAFVEKVRAALPDTRIAISSLTPSPARWSEAEIAKHANRIIRDYVATQRNVVFIDLFDAYLGPDGKPREELFVEDGLHHSAAAYRVRIRAMRGILGEPDKKRSNENRSGIADGREVALGDDLHLSTTHRDDASARLPAHQGPAGFVEVRHDVTAAALDEAALGRRPLMDSATIPIPAVEDHDVLTLAHKFHVGIGAGFRT